MKNRLLFFAFALLGIAQGVIAQTGSEAFAFLRYPFSARANALGGNTVSLIERDPTLIFHNPGLLGMEMDEMISLSYMNYIADINVGSALFTKASGERGAWGIGAGFISYGHFDQKSAENTSEGTFSAKDINVSAFYAYDLTDRWRGGLSLKFLYSSFDIYTSIGLCADAGVSYYDRDKGVSFGFALKNIGAQLKAYNEDRQTLPWDIQLGATKKLQNAPIRLSATAMYLKQWKLEYIDEASGSAYKDDSFFQTFAKHLVFGVDFIPSENFWIGAGFNPKVNQDMKLQSGNKLGGFSFGAGVVISKFEVSASLTNYHPSATSFMMGISTALSEFR